MDISTGGVYFVPDDILTLPPDSRRDVHTERRPFVVVSGDTFNSNLQWPIVLGCPVSSSTQWKTDLCVKVGAGAANLPKKGWIRVAALQPVLKSELEDKIGDLPGGILDLLRTRILQYTGMVA